MRYKALHIKNSRVYKDIVIPLANQGLVAIHGANGVGKSTPWDLMNAVQYHVTPNGHKEDDLVRDKRDALIGLEYEFDGHEVFVKHKRVKKKWKYEILQDGVDITPHTVVDGRKLARKLTSLSQPEFQGAVHLTQGAQHLLITGQPGERNKYISGFFGLSELGFEALHEKAILKRDETEIMIERLEKLITQKELLESQLQQLPDVDLAPLNQQIVDVNKCIADTTTIQMKLVETSKVWQTYNTMVAEATRYEDPNLNLTLASDQIGKLEAEIQTAADRKRLNIEADAVNAKVAQLSKALQDLLLSHPGIDSVSTQVYMDLRTRYDQQRGSEHLVKEYESIKMCLPELPLTELEKTVQDLSLISAQQTHKINAIASGKCPTCGAGYSSEDLQALNQELQEHLMYLAAAKVDLVQVQTRNRTAKRKLDLEPIVNQMRPLMAQELEDFVRMSQLVERKPSYDSLVSQLSTLKPRELLHVVETDAPVRLNDLKIVRAELQRCCLAKQQCPPKPEIDELAVDMKLIEYGTLMTHYGTTRNELYSQLGTAQTQIRAKTNLVQQIADLALKTVEMPKLMTDYLFWKKMVEAYGPKGLKVKHLSNIMDMVVSRMPHYANVLFQERGLTFSHSCDSDSISIIANRTMEDGEIFSKDISTFSGGEKKRVSVALVLTLADCVPAHKRSNILILDEIDDALDAAGQYRFVNDLLPMLKRDYESVFVISHAEEVKQAAIYDQFWKVTKHHHYSTIDMQRVS